MPDINSAPPISSGISQDSLVELQSFLTSTTIPVQQKRKRTFLDISGFPHYERVNSNWYAYFLRENETHGLGRLFIDALLTIANRKTNSLPVISSFVVEQEYATNKRKRIDILIKGIEADEGKYIIIENKIYHWLHNDLSDYWNSCIGTTENKLGIILSLSTQTIPIEVADQYVNILHSEVVSQIRSMLDNSAAQSPYLPDFLSSIDNLYKDLYMNEEILFYYQNIEKCNRIYDIADKAHEFICEQINIAGQKLHLQYVGQAEDYRYLCIPGINDVFYTIIIHQLFEKPYRIQIIIELNRNGIALQEHIQNACGKDSITSRGLNFKTFTSSIYMHYASKTYEIPFESLAALSDFIVQSIQSDFEATMTEIINCINQNKS